MYRLSRWTTVSYFEKVAGLQRASCSSRNSSSTSSMVVFGFRRSSDMAGLRVVPQRQGGFGHCRAGLRACRRRLLPPALAGSPAALVAIALIGDLGHVAKARPL